MNEDTIDGGLKSAVGTVKQAVGDATGDQNLATEGVADQVVGNATKALGNAKDAIAPLAEKARTFAKERPWATAALVGTIGLALVNALRGRK